MNHAAYLIQRERNQLNDLIHKKEKMLIQMQEAVNKNNDMLQSEVTKMNAQRQGYNKHVAELNQKIRELENGGNSKS